MSKQILALGVLLACMFSGCEILGSTGPQHVGDFVCGDYPVCTDKQAYNSLLSSHSRYKLVIRFENRETVPVYLERCHQDIKIPVFGFEYVEDDSIGSAFNPGWGCVGGIAGFLVLPGAARIDTLTVFPRSFSHGEPFGAVSGAHRFYYRQQPCCGDRHGISKRVYSNTFILN